MRQVGASRRPAIAREFSAAFAQTRGPAGIECAVLAPAYLRALALTLLWASGMSKTMKAAVVHQFGAPLQIEDVAIPTPKAGEVLVKIMASGVCHTDLHAEDGDWPVKPALPFIPGHAGA